MGLMKKILREVETVTFSKHFYDEKVRLRGLDEEEIKQYLKELEKLIQAEDQGEELKGHKYALLFSKSNKYDLKIAVSIKGKSLNVITTHIQNIKKRKAYEKWLGKQK